MLSLLSLSDVFIFAYFLFIVHAVGDDDGTDLRDVADNEQARIGRNYPTCVFGTFFCYTWLENETD